MNHTRISVSDRLLASGNSRFMREVAASAATEIETIAKQFPQTSEDRCVDLPVQGTPVADVSVVAGLIGVVCFVGSWAASKALDELYRAKLAPVVRRALSKYLEKDEEPAKCGAALLLYNTHEGASVFIVSIADDLEQLEDANDDICRTMSLIRANLNDASNVDGVHLYVIEGGLCNLAPIKCSNIDAAMREVSAVLPRQPSKSS